MNQKTKYILLNFFTILLIFGYVWTDQNIQKNFNNKKKELDDLNIQLVSEDASMKDIQELRKNFTQEKKALNDSKISGKEILQEINTLRNLARSMDMELKKLTIDPRNTLPQKSVFKNNNMIDFARQTVNFEICGNFLDIGIFIETIEQRSEKLKLQQCSISLDSLDPRGVLARIEYLTYNGSN